jgi:16S rRNA (adenine1518-N6/adenine1519-N6)-dimethyltransferase
MSRAKKSLGQNFLAAESVARRIAGALHAAPGDLIFEIGAGRGALTAPLAESGATVVAYEIDAGLVELLREKLQDFDNVDVRHADIREVAFDAEAARLGRRSYKVVGNIPYNLTSTILLDLARAKDCRVAVLMVQREVGERILSSPGERNCGILSIFLQSYCKIQKVLKVRPGSFTPPPKVESVVLRFLPDSSIGGPLDREGFLAFIKRAFLHRRKKLRNLLPELAADAAGEARQEEQPAGRVGRKPAGRATGTEGAKQAPGRLAALSGIDFGLRPEELDRESWFTLFAASESMKGSE